jgi:predicted O-methyltransferase YrrM
VLAAGKHCAETGTAFGEGAAAMAATAKSLVTVELDAGRAEIAAGRLRGLDNVELIVGDWREHLPRRAPYDLLFFDAGRAEDSQAAIELLADGGLVWGTREVPPIGGPSQPKKALATANQSSGTVFSSAVASLSGTSTMRSPCSAAMRPNFRSSTRSAAFRP